MGQQIKGWDSNSRDGTANQGMGQQIKGWDQEMGQQIKECAGERSGIPGLMNIPL